ncbi:MAG: serine hydrolase domain-containing protein [Ferruginibacter sp.]
MSYVRDSKMPNAVAFIARHGKIVYNKAFGYRNIENKILVKNDDIFRIASQTKGFTSVALMTLFEDNKFLLDDPISQYIPEFKNPQVIVAIDEKDSTATTKPASREITIRDLLRHTSGIPYGNVLFAKQKIPAINSLGNESIGAVVKRLAKLPLEHNPGEKFTYGLNTDVLSYLIEVISGIPLNKFLKKSIFDPLDMKDTYFYLPQNKVQRLVPLYSKDSLTGPLYYSKSVDNQTFPYAGAQQYFSGGAGLVGTIEDYAKFCQMLLNGGTFNNKKILGRKTIDLMTTNQIGEKEVWDTKNKFGLGFEIITQEGATKLPGSVGSFRWGGAYTTEYTIDPKEDLILLIYTNVLPFAHPNIVGRFRIMVYQALE